MNVQEDVLHIQPPAEQSGTVVVLHPEDDVLTAGVALL